MKACIVTLVGRNYGNRLQNYALQRALQKKGLDINTLYIKEKLSAKLRFVAKACLSLFIRRFRKDVKAKLRSFRSGSPWNEFDRLIHWEKRNILNPDICSQYDFFVVGSDQVWNPYFAGQELFFLNFAPECKRIAYAASIGVDDIPESRREYYQKKLEGIRRISVREHKGAEIVKKLIGKDALVVLDPVMLLDAGEWREVASSAKVQPGKGYIFKYFLGRCAPEYEEWIERLARENGWTIWDIDMFGDCGGADIGPAEFVKLVADSAFVCTDSFHGAVFALLFHKTFRIFERPWQKGAGKMTSRIETLLLHFGITDGLVGSPHELASSLSFVDYDYFELVLAKERVKASAFIDSVFNDC